MDLELLFSLINIAVMPGWLILVFLPRWRHGPSLIAGVILPGLMALFYVTMLIIGIPDTPEGGSFSTLEGVMVLLGHPQGMLVGWAHYLAFDLFVGAWEVRDAQKEGIPHLAVVPCLLFSLMLGPTGLLMYLLLRAVLRRKVALT